MQVTVFAISFSQKEQLWYLHLTTIMSFRNTEREGLNPYPTNVENRVSS